jgi:uncharacterized protein with FMN-binding domain
MAQSGSNKKVANSLVAVSSAAVLAVYAAGFTRTRSAAVRFEAQAAERRPAVPGPPRTAPAIAEVRPVAPNAPLVPAPSVPALSTSGLSGATGHGPTASAEPEPKAAAVPGAAVAPTPVETSAIEEPPVPVVEHKVEVAPTVPAPPTPPSPPAPAWKDGTYLGWGTSRHGDIQASVVIEGGRIASATIAQCWTRYSCSVIDKLPPQVAQRQSPEVDFVSGATQSANAFYYGVVDALSKAK